jgi:hypothetical protein
MGRHAVAVAKAPDVGGENIDRPPQQDAIARQPSVSLLVSQYERALLPWESPAEFRALHAAFHAEHQPKGATEVSLVDQLAWIEWRRRRLVLGERAAHMASLQDRIGEDYKTKQTLSRALIGQEGRAEKDELAETLRHAPERDQADVDDAVEDERMTRKGIAILEGGGTYAKGLAAIRDDTRGWWSRVLAEDVAIYPDGQPIEGEDYIPYRTEAFSLLRFLKDDVLPIIEEIRTQASRRPAIRLQAHGESVDPFRVDRIFALDERLTRQFGKTLAMLIRLREVSVPSRAA